MSENEGYRFYREVLGSPKHVLAPMVDQSELPFRKMARELGVHLCYTPMWHAAIFSKDPKYRQLAIEQCPEDRPLLFQVMLHVVLFQYYIYCFQYKFSLFFF